MSATPPPDVRAARRRLMASAAISGVALGLAFEHRYLAYLVLVALVPWLGAVRGARHRDAAASAGLFGVSLFALQMWWVVPFVGRWTGNFGLAVLPWAVVLGLAFVVYLPLGIALRWALVGRRAVLVPLVWVSHEVLRAYLPDLAFPWAYLATPLIVHPEAVQHAAWGTVWLVSATAVGVNLAALWSYECLRARCWTPKPALALGCSLALPLAAATRLATAAPASSLRVTLGQHGYDMAFGDPEGRARAFGQFASAAVSLAQKDGSDLLVLPEGFSQADARDGPPPTALGDHPPLPAMFGSFRVVGDKTYQAAYLYDGSWRFADKTKLVVFGEFVPFRNQLPVLKSFNLSPVDLTPGAVLQVMPFRGKTLAPMVCFEGVFPELGVRQADLGAQAFVQMSIDDWYAGTQAHEQLWKSSVWRSVENGLPLVRVGAQGQSLVTDHRGRISLMLPQKRPQATTATVPMPERSDAFPYRYWFAWFACAAGLVALGAGTAAGLGKRRDEPSTSG